MSEVTPKKAAELSGYSLDYIWELCRGGRIKHRMVLDHYYLIDQEDLTRYVAEMSQDARGGPRPGKKKKSDDGNASSDQ